MKKVLLLRDPSTDQGTFGKLITEGFSCVTLELPWKENRSNISSIPAGKYRCYWTYSPRFKRRMYLVDGVPGRAGIRIHPANIYSQLNGCIALGETLGVMGTKINGQPTRVQAILRSAPAVREFETLMDGKPFLLEILNA